MNLVWFQGRIPKAAFILWLAIKGKLGTQDRLFHIDPGIHCLLCGLVLESHDHLFFECTITAQIWEAVLHKGGIRIPTLPWNALWEWMASNWKGSSLHTKISKLCLAVSVYWIWKERNTRFHSSVSRRVDAIVHSIFEQVRLKGASYVRVKDTISNRLCQASWNLLTESLIIRGVPLLVTCCC